LVQIAAPQMAVSVIDKAIQAHGGAGYTQKPNPLKPQP